MLELAFLKVYRYFTVISISSPWQTLLIHLPCFLIQSELSLRIFLTTACQTTPAIDLVKLVMKTFFISELLVFDLNNMLSFHLCNFHP